MEPTNNFEQPNQIKDTIPSEIKKYFFTNISPPKILDYDVLGFDVDHCMVKYKVEPLARFLI